MKNFFSSTDVRKSLLVYLLFAVIAMGCSPATPKQEPKATRHIHEHKSPHGGTAIELGNEEFHLELVREPNSDQMKLYVLDGELENYVRIASPEIIMVMAEAAAGQETLQFKAMADQATGETIGNTSFFQSQADWLKAKTNFTASIKLLQIRDREYRDVPVKYPQDHDAK